MTEFPVDAIPDEDDEPKRELSAIRVTIALLVVFGLLGMDPTAAFPIMMGSGAFVATVAGVRFVGARRFHWRAALGLSLGGIPGVAVAVWLVKSLPLAALRWLVLVVVSYAAITLLKAGVRDSSRP